MASINQLEITKQFERKVNFANEKQRLSKREVEFEKKKWIEENKTALEAIEETKRVKTYFRNDEEAKEFAHLIRDQKEVEKMAFNWEVLEKNEKIGFKSSSSTVIPTRSEIS